MSGVRRGCASATCDSDVILTMRRAVSCCADMSKMKNNAIVGNIGHFDNEIDMAGLYAWPGESLLHRHCQYDTFAQYACIVAHPMLCSAVRK